MDLLRSGDRRNWAGCWGRDGGTPLSDFLEGVTGCNEDSGFARVVLPAPDRDIDVVGINLERGGPPAGAFSSDQHSATSSERVEHEVVAPRAVLDGIRHKCNRFYGRVHGELLEFGPA